MRDLYKDYIFESNLPGSNKAASYLRALDLLNEILNRPNSVYARKVDFWSIDSPDEIERLYVYAVKNQKTEGSEFLQPDLPPSYGRNGYYSAALKSYGKFLYERQLWNVVENAARGDEIADRIKERNIEPAGFITDDDKEGEDVLRETKNRLNQDFFRKMILSNYGKRCAVSGLNVPEVLRASHIIPWSEDKKNRLNPCNGLCLSATYDAAFDRHLISFDKDYRMIFSAQLAEYHTNEAFKRYFKAFEGKRLVIPDRFPPSQRFLEKHREKLR